MISQMPAKSRDTLSLTNERMRRDITGPESHKAGGTQRGTSAMQLGWGDLGIRVVGSYEQWDAHSTY